MSRPLHLVLASFILCLACGDTPAGPTAPTVEPFPPLRFVAPFLGESVPDYSGDWNGSSRLTGCRPSGPGCQRAGQANAVSPTRVRLTVSQAGVNLSGTLTVGSPDAYTLVGHVTADGGFVIWGSRRLYEFDVEVSGRFMRAGEHQVSGTIVTEQRREGRLVTTSRYEGNLTREASAR